MLMLQLSYIRENKEEVIARLAVKNCDAKEMVEKIDNPRASGEMRGASYVVHHYY